MNTVFAIQFTNYIYEEYSYESIDNSIITKKDNRILDNKIYMNPEDAVLALQSILETLSKDEEHFVEEGMHVYSVASYELV
tara:strand:- start:6 stop:248 length:243 start_codon:yes stop_codon:yes gene_type:complete